LVVTLLCFCGAAGLGPKAQEKKKMVAAGMLDKHGALSVFSSHPFSFLYGKH
jgi:hypothetical protein